MFAKAGLALILSVGIAHSSLAGVQPSEFLDERTGATIIVAHDPLVFPLVRTFGAKNEERDFISLTAVEVDRSGELQMFLIGYVWSMADRLTKSLNLRTDDREFELIPERDFPGELLDDRKLHPPSRSYARRTAYRVTREILGALASGRHLKLRLSVDASVADGEPPLFDVWGGQKSLAAFVDRIGAVP
jgi:hypothetical protein